MTLPPTKPTTSQALTLRPGIEEETILLNKAVTFADAAAEGILNGSIKSSEAHALLGSGRLMAAVAKQSITDRVGRSRIIAQEAKIIEAPPHAGPHPGGETKGDQTAENRTRQS